MADSKGVSVRVRNSLVEPWWSPPVKNRSSDPGDVVLGLHAGRRRIEEDGPGIVLQKSAQNELWQSAGLSVKGSAMVDQMISKLNGFAGKAAQLSRQQCGLDISRCVVPEVLGVKFAQRAAGDDPPCVVLTQGLFRLLRHWCHRAASPGRGSTFLEHPHQEVSKNRDDVLASPTEDLVGERVGARSPSSS